MTKVINIPTFGYMSLVIIRTFDHKQYAAESAPKANCYLVSQEVPGTSKNESSVSCL